MAVEQALIAILGAADTSMEGRFYPDTLPQPVTLPAGRYQRITTPRVRSLSGPSGLAMPRIQIDLYATTRLAVDALAAEVRAALDGFTGLAAGILIEQCSIDNDQSTYEPTSQRYKRILDVLIHHEET